LKRHLRNLHQNYLTDVKKATRAQFQNYKLYYKAMYNTSLRIVSDTMEAEDVMQESFLAAFEKMIHIPNSKLRGLVEKKLWSTASLDALEQKESGL